MTYPKSYNLGDLGDLGWVLRPWLQWESQIGPNMSMSLKLKEEMNCPFILDLLIDDD